MKISVISAVYNRAATLPDALRSLDQQTYTDWENVVVDGHSTDGSLEVIGTFKDPRRLVVSEPDRGIYDALNKGLARCRGEVIGFLHSDDFFYDPTVLGQVAKIFENPQIDMAFGNLIYCDRHRKRVTRVWRARSLDSRLIRWGWHPPHTTLWIRRAVFQQVGPFDTLYSIASDYDWMIRAFAVHHLKAVWVPHFWLSMRRGGVSNQTLRNIIQANAECFASYRKNRLGRFPLFILLKPFRKLFQYFTFGVRLPSFP